VVYTSGHCHHLSVECLALAPTGKSYPILRQEMQDAFRPEHMRQEAECARVDFPCSSLEQDLKDGKMMTMTLYPPQRGFLYRSTGTASATSLLPLFISKAFCFLQEKQGETIHTFFLNDQKESVQRKSRRHRFIGQFFLYTNGVNLNTLFTPCLLNYMAFSSSHPVLIQKPRRSPLRRGKLLLYVIAVNTLCL